MLRRQKHDRGIQKDQKSLVDETQWPRKIFSKQEDFVEVIQDILALTFTT